MKTFKDLWLEEAKPKETEEAKPSGVRYILDDPDGRSTSGPAPEEQAALDHEPMIREKYLHSYRTRNQ